MSNIVKCCWCDILVEVPADDSYYCDVCDTDCNDRSKVICFSCMDKHYEHGCVLCPYHHEEET
ncbi:MAG TPA: hypothetical protein VEP90_04425, partial [Methylomirabilota bacterium]|nr:hypothetical protein [Methylomirabilota bacterium]